MKSSGIVRGNPTFGKTAEAGRCGQITAEEVDATDLLSIDSSLYNDPMDSPSEPIDADAPASLSVPSSFPLRLSLREFLGLATIIALVVGLTMTTRQLARVEHELTRLRLEVGHLMPSEPGQIAASRAPSDQPLTYRVRVRVPESPGYRLAYSSVLPRDSQTPDWYGAIKVPPGESLVTVRVAEDPRDGRWKITTLVGSPRGNQRMATTLPAEHVRAFRGTHDVVSTGVGRETLAVGAEGSIRVLDERWLVGDGSLLLYGDRPTQRDQLGIYAELQPDRGTL
jgi:hypothetical protein